MPVYSFDKTSLIDEVTLIKNAGGGERAYLHARDGATPEELGETMKKLLEAGYLSVPYEYKGKAVLELRGFGKEEKLLDMLNAEAITTGGGRRHVTADDDISWKQKFSKHSFMVSALLYLIGDLSFILYEKKRDEGTKRGIWNWLGGYGYLTGTSTSIASMLLSKDPSEDQIHKATIEVVTASRRAGIKLESDSPLLRAAADRHENPLLKTFTKHSAELMNLGFAAAGLGIAQKNLQDVRALKAEEREADFALKDDFQKQEHKKSLTHHQKDVALGFITMASGLTSSFVKETPRDKNKPRKSGLAGVIEFFKEKPLRIAGYGYLVSTLIHLDTSIEERMKIKKKNRETGSNDSVAHTTSRLIFVLTNLIAEVIMTLSSKGHGQGVKSDDSIDPSTCALVADMIHKKPADMRAQLVDQMAGFLSMPDALGTDANKLKAIINEQLAALDKNPWANVLKKQETPLLDEAVTDNEKAPSYSLEKKAHPRINQTTETGIGTSLT